jgi:SAM-dependent methyltransferase
VASAADRKTKPRLWQPTYLLNRALLRDLRRCVGPHLAAAANRPRVLDVGCGRKPYEDLLAAYVAEYVGCDYFPSDDRTIKCPADALAFPDAAFDATLCFQVLEHVPEPWLVVAECARVLKPGGLAVFTAPFAFPHHPSPRDYYRFSHEGLAHLVERSGLAVSETRVQCNLLTTICLYANWLLWLVAMRLRRWPTRPAAWLIHALAMPLVNFVGVLCDGLRIPRDFAGGNAGYSNVLLVARKPAGPR